MILTYYDFLKNYNTPNKMQPNIQPNMQPNMQPNLDQAQVMQYIFNKKQNNQSQLDPYNQKGADQLDYLQQNINALSGNANNLGDNTQLYNQLNSGYQNDPNTLYRIQQMLNFNRNSNAVEGTVGSGYHNFDDMNAINTLTAAGQQDYFNNRLNLYNSGLNLSQGLNNNGLQAANSLEQNKLSQQSINLAKQQYDNQNNPLRLFGRAAAQIVGALIKAKIGSA